MSQAEARAWWADVEHLREPLEQRRHARPPSTPGGVSARRTVKIRGHAVPGAPAKALRVVTDAEPVEAQSPARVRRRPPRRPVELIGARPDRMAGWAVGIALLMVLVAVVTAHG